MRYELNISNNGRHFAKVVLGGDLLDDAVRQARIIQKAFIALQSYAVGSERDNNWAFRMTLWEQSGRFIPLDPKESADDQA